LDGVADDYRLFCGDLGNEVNEDVLSKAFSKFPSFNMAKVCSVRSFILLSNTFTGISCHEERIFCALEVSSSSPFFLNMVFLHPKHS